MSRNPPHKWLLDIQPNAKRVFNTLSPTEKRSVFRQLHQLLDANDPYNLPFVEMLQSKQFARTRKFRVGDFRVFFAVENKEVTHLKHQYRGTLFLLDIRNRREAY